MRVKCEVVGRSLTLGRPTINVGERVWLDTDDPMHRQALDRGFVRRVETAAVAAAPVNRMIEGAQTKGKGKPGPKPRAGKAA